MLEEVSFIPQPEIETPVRPNRRSSDSEKQRMEGSIRKIKQDRGFGFIAGDDGTDYFFHWTGFEKTSPKDFRGLEMYDRVSFVPIDSKERGPRAIQIRYLV